MYQVWTGYHDSLHNEYATYRNMMMGKPQMNPVKTKLHKMPEYYSTQFLYVDDSTDKL
jgi:hypothetical protein